MKSRKDKKYDSVKMMREIRDKLSQKYSNNLEKELEDLNKVKEKYRIKSKVKVA